MSEQKPHPTPEQERLHAIEHAFKKLEDRLTEASRILHSSTSAECKLHTVISCLKAVLEFLKIAPRAFLQIDPLIRLYADLRSLEKGARPSMLTPKPRYNRPPAPLLYKALKGMTVFTVHRLMGTGLSRADARKAVAKTLNQRGVSAAGRHEKVTERTIRKWEDDIGIDSFAKRILHDFESEFKNDLLNIFFDDLRLPEDFSIKTVEDADLILKQVYGTETRIVFLGWLRLFSCI